MKYLREQWREDKLRWALVVCWLLTVISSFFGSYLLPIELPGIGTWYAFRTLLPVTAVLYAVCAIRTKTFFWRDSSTLEKWCYVFIASVGVYAVLSVFRAIDLSFSIGRILNLLFMLLLLFLALRLCRSRDVRRLTLWACGAMLVVIMLLGVYEVFCGGLVNTKYDNLQQFNIFFRKGQLPVVFSGNTNDYNAAILLLIAAAVVSVFSVKKEERSRGMLWYLVFLFAGGYFLAMAGGARLCEIGYFILLAAVLLYAFFSREKCRWVPIVILCCFLGVQFISHSHYIIPQTQAYVQSLADPDKPNMSFFDIFRNPDAGNLSDEFVTVDDKTGDKTLNDNGSAGVRVKLLFHAGKCFLDSKGLGVGVGNTEILARDGAVIENSRIWSIHCFLARIVADCGIFALIPLCAIAILLLKNMLRSMAGAIRRKEGALVGRCLLLLAALVNYPIVSTTPSDAQDIVAMWLFLAILVLYTTELPTDPEARKKNG